MPTAKRKPQIAVVDWKSAPASNSGANLEAKAIGATAVFYVFAIMSTTVANTVVILSLSPLVSAALAWVVLRETLSGSTLAALVVAVAGVVVMCADGLTAGGLSGIVIAFGAVT